MKETADGSREWTSPVLSL